MGFSTYGSDLLLKGTFIDLAKGHQPAGAKAGAQEQAQGLPQALGGRALEWLMEHQRRGHSHSP